MKLKDNQNVLFVWLQGLLFMNEDKYDLEREFRLLLTDVIKEHGDLLS